MVKNVEALVAGDAKEFDGRPWEVEAAEPQHGMMQVLWKSARSAGGRNTWREPRSSSLRPLRSRESGWSRMRRRWQSATGASETRSPRSRSRRSSTWATGCLWIGPTAHQPGYVNISDRPGCWSRPSCRGGVQGTSGPVTPWAADHGASAAALARRGIAARRIAYPPLALRARRTSGWTASASVRAVHPLSHARRQHPWRMPDAYSPVRKDFPTNTENAQFSWSEAMCAAAPPISPSSPGTKYTGTSRLHTSRPKP